MTRSSLSRTLEVCRARHRHRGLDRSSGRRCVRRAGVRFQDVGNEPQRTDRGDHFLPLTPVPPGWRPDRLCRQWHLCARAGSRAAQGLGSPATSTIRSATRRQKSRPQPRHPRPRHVALPCRRLAPRDRASSRSTPAGVPHATAPTRGAAGQRPRRHGRALRSPDHRNDHPWATSSQSPVAVPPAAALPAPLPTPPAHHGRRFAELCLPVSRY